MSALSIFRHAVSLESGATYLLTMVSIVTVVCALVQLNLCCSVGTTYKIFPIPKIALDFKISKTKMCVRPF